MFDTFFFALDQTGMFTETDCLALPKENQPATNSNIKFEWLEDEKGTLQLQYIYHSFTQ